MDSSQPGSSIASTIQDQNSTRLSSLNNSGVADIIQCVTSTPSSTQRWSIMDPTATIGTSSRNTPAPSRTSQTDSMSRVVSSPASSIASTPTPLSGHANRPTPIPNPEARAIISDQLQTEATDRSQRQRQWQLQQQAVSTHRSMVSSSRCIHQYGHSDMKRRVFGTGRLMELYMWNRPPLMSASSLETVHYEMRRVATALAETPHGQIIETYWNTAMKQNIIWFIAFEARTTEIWKVVCWSNGPRWILHPHTGTRFEHISTMFNPIIFN